MPDLLLREHIKLSLIDLLDEADRLYNERMALLTLKTLRGYAFKAAPLTQSERDIQDELQAVFGKYADKMAALVKQGKNIPASLYDSMDGELQDVLISQLGAAYIASATSAQMALGNSVGIQIDWAAPNIGAQKWVNQYSFDLVRGLSDTTQAQVQANIASLQRDISDFFEKPTTLAELRGNIARYIPDWQDRLGKVWSSAERAEMIATTEVTRASVQGEIDQADYLQSNYGIELIPVWQTSNDEIVCPICAPRHNKQQGNGWEDPPPAHPRCRCAISLELKR